jgi:hypothetical protein
MNWSGAQKGEGFEYHLLALAVTAFLMIRGAGAFSLDRVGSKGEPEPTIRDKIACDGGDASADAVLGKAMDRLSGWRVDRTCHCHLADGNQKAKRSQELKNFVMFASISFRFVPHLWSDALIILVGFAPSPSVSSKRGVADLSRGITRYRLGGA